MMRFTIDEARALLEDLIADALRGETVVIDTKSALDVRLIATPRPPIRQPRQFGSARGLIRTADDFNEPLEDFRAYMGFDEPVDDKDTDHDASDESGSKRTLR